MSSDDALTQLRDLYREKSVLRGRHELNARTIRSYEVNNTYQYVIAREEMHLAWLAAAIAAARGTLPETPEVQSPVRTEGDVLRADAQDAQQFVDRWTAPVQAMTNARNRSMIRVILGETLEHKRFFEQAAGGRLDLLGRRPAEAGTGGGVLPTRWLE